MKETKDVVSFVVSLGNALGKSLDDGTIDLADSVNLLGPIMALPDAADGFSKVAGEIQAMSAEQRGEIVEMIKRDFDIPQDSVEALVEKAISIASDLVGFVGDLRTVAS